MKQTLKDQPYEKNIVIEDNEFRTFDNSILSALSVDGLIFRNNKIIESGTYPKLWPGLPVIEVRDGLNTLIQNNSFEGKEKARIVIDENSSRSLKIDKKQKGICYRQEVRILQLNVIRISFFILSIGLFTESVTASGLKAVKSGEWNDPTCGIRDECLR